MHLFQTPPDVNITIHVDMANTLIKMLGMGAADMDDDYRANVEYWRYSDVSSDKLDNELLLTQESSLGWTREDVDSYFSGHMFAGTCPRTDPTWSTGRRRVPEGRAGHLYSMADPDDLENAKMGVLLETSGTGADARLVLVAFYKNWVHSSGLIWKQAPVGDVPLTRVKNNSGAHSTDPDDIDSDKIWHCTLMKMP